MAVGGGRSAAARVKDDDIAMGRGVCHLQLAGHIIAPGLGMAQRGFGDASGEVEVPPDVFGALVAASSTFQNPPLGSDPSISQ